MPHFGSHKTFISHTPVITKLIKAEVLFKIDQHSRISKLLLSFHETSFSISLIKFYTFPVVIKPYRLWFYTHQLESHLLHVSCILVIPSCNETQSLSLQSVCQSNLPSWGVKVICSAKTTASIVLCFISPVLNFEGINTFLPKDIPFLP